MCFSLLSTGEEYCSSTASGIGEKCSLVFHGLGFQQRKYLRDTHKPEAILLSLTLLVFERFLPSLTLWSSPNCPIGEEQSKTAFAPVLKKPPTKDAEVMPTASFLKERIAGLGVKEQVASSRKHAADAANTVTKWRSAEIQVMQYLESQDWRVTDVSKRNVGYDLEGTSPDGETFYFETKSLSRVGEIFSLSTNEEVVARQHGKNYILALVHISSRYFEIDMIPDPPITWLLCGNVSSGHGCAKRILLTRNASNIAANDFLGKASPGVRLKSDPSEASPNCRLLRELKQRGNRLQTQFRYSRCRMEHRRSTFSRPR